MNRPLPWIFLAALLGAVAWVALWPGDEGSVEPIPGVEHGSASGDPSGSITAGGGLRGTGITPPAPRAGPTPRPSPTDVDPKDIPRGTLEVLPLGPDNLPISSSELSMRLEPVGRPFYAQPLAIPDPETMVWVYRDVPAGRMKLYVTGDHVLETEMDAVIEAGKVQSVKVHVDRAGAVSYRVVLYSGEQPEEATVTLLDAHDRPVKARYQVRTEKVLTQPQTVTTMKQGPDGIILGVPPGRYRLKGVSPA